MNDTKVVRIAGVKYAGEHTLRLQSLRVRTGERVAQRYLAR